MKKLTLIAIEQFILENKQDIYSLDEKELPMVLADLQAEQAVMDGIEDHRNVKDISKEAFIKVFPCYWELNEVEVNTLFMNQ